MDAINRAFITITAEEQGLQNSVKTRNPMIALGAGARNRTGMPLRAGDFESPASTSFTTPAQPVSIVGLTNCQEKCIDKREIPMLILGPY